MNILEFIVDCTLHCIEKHPLEDEEFFVEIQTRVLQSISDLECTQLKVAILAGIISRIHDEIIIDEVLRLIH